MTDALAILQSGLEHHRQGRFDEAATAYAAAVQRRPGLTEAHYLLGAANNALGNPDKAVPSLTVALRLDPGLVDARQERGKAYLMLGQWEAARGDLKLAVEAEHERADAWLMLAQAAARLGQGADSECAYRRAIALAPSRPEAHVNFALSAHAQQRFEATVRLNERALAISPTLAPALNNAGTAYHRLARPRPSRRSYHRALALEPMRADTWHNLGALERADGVMGASVLAYGRAVALLPSMLDAWQALATLSDFLGDSAGADRAHRMALIQVPGYLPASRALMGALVLAAEIDEPEILRRRLQWSRDWAPKPDGRPFANSPEPDRPIRIGYIAGPNLCGNTHAFVALPGFEGLDRRGLEIVVYSDLPAEREDGYTGRYRAASDHWHRSVDWTDAELGERIRADGIDVLVDLCAHLGGPRFQVLAAKPAPVQVLNLALGTSGLPAADWVVADRWLVPESAETAFSERVLLLPHGYVYDPLITAPPVGALPALRTGRISFGCANALVKVTRSSIALWARVLDAVPESRLIVKGRGFSEPWLKRRFASWFAAAGVAPERVELRGWAADYLGHLRFHEEIDIALDPIPYNGVTTTCEALWMGVPVVTYPGDRMAGRYGEALLRAAGIEEGRTPTAGGYVAEAARLARDLDGLARLRSELRARVKASALCEGKAYGAALAAAYRHAWKDWCGRR